MAKVDILLPFWGDIGLFKEAVNSVIEQTEKDWRLLIFDDCYPSDEPKAFVSELKDPRVIYARNQKNLGITANFNHALNSAEADHCVMFGCDDRMLPNYLATALKNVGDADFYQPGVEVINQTGQTYLPLGDRVKGFLRPKRLGIHGGEQLAASLCTGNWLYFPSILWNTASIKKYGFDTRYKITEDLILELTIIKEGGTLYVDNDVTFQYRRFSESLSSTEKSKGGVRFKEELETYARFQHEFRDMGWYKASRAAKWRLTSRLHQLIS